MTLETKDTENWIIAFQVASTNRYKCAKWKTQMTKYFSWMKIKRENSSVS